MNVENIATIKVGGAKFVVEWSEELSETGQRLSCMVERVKMGGVWFDACVFTREFCREMDDALMALEDNREAA